MNDEFKLKHSLNNTNKLMETYEYLFNKYKGLVAFVASKYLNTSEDVDDAISETFLTLFNNPESVKTSIKGFLTITAKGVAIKMLNERKKTEITEDETAFVYEDSSANYKLLIEEIKKCLEEKEFIIFYQHLILDKTFKEISSSLKMNENSVKTIYFRSLTKVKGEIV